MRQYDGERTDADQSQRCWLRSLSACLEAHIINGDEAVLRVFNALGVPICAERGGYFASKDQLGNILLALRPFQLSVKSVQRIAATACFQLASRVFQTGIWR